MLGLLAVLLGLGVLGATVASAHTPIPTSSVKVVDWKTSLAPGIKTPYGSADVTWPQTLVTDIPKCGNFWIQEDTYTYNAKTKDAVDDLIKHGILNKPGSKDWTDTSFNAGWKFIYIKPCVTDTPTPTPTTSTPTPTPSITTPTPTPTITTPIPTPVPAAKVTPTLPNTGLPFNPLYLVALAGLLLLAGSTTAFKKHKTREH